MNNPFRIAGLLGTTMCILMVFLAGCNNHHPHWEKIAPFKESGRFAVIADSADIQWNNVIENSALWNNISGADSTKPAPGTITVAQIDLSISDPGLIEGALIQADSRFPFLAYLNGKELISYQKGEIIPDYQPPWKPAKEQPIFAFYRSANFVIKKEEFQKAVRQGKNKLILIIPTHEKFRLKYLKDYSFSLAVDAQANVYTHQEPNLTPDESFTRSELPVLKISTLGMPVLDEPKTPVKIELFSPKSKLTNPDVELRGGIELRGNTAQLMSKKSYGIKLEVKKELKDILGLPLEKKWVLYGPYMDRTLLRNAFAYQLYQQMGHYSTRFRFCELIINNQYLGIYMLTEKIEFEKNRLQGNKAEKNNPEAKGIEGDFLLEIDRGKKSGWTSHWGHAVNEGAHYFEFEDPKKEDLNQDQIKHVQQFVESFEQTLFTDPDPENSLIYQQFINEEKFIDFIILNEVTKNIDAYRLSTFLVKRGQPNGGKLETGPVWDFNLAFGLANYDNGYHPEGFVYEGNHHTLPFWWKWLMNNRHFKNKLSKRYTALRQSVLHHNELKETWNSLIDEVEPAVNRNFEKWTVLSQKEFWPNYHGAESYEEACEQLNVWLEKRLLWLDEHWGYHTES